MWDSEMSKIIAYGRAAYLEEPIMAQELGLPMETLTGPPSNVT